MSGINLAEIAKLLSAIDRLGVQVGDLFGQIKQQVEKEKDIRKRKKLLAACAKHDLRAIREILWD